MQDHTVAVDAARTPTGLAFAGAFNVAVPSSTATSGRGGAPAWRSAMRRAP